MNKLIGGVLAALLLMACGTTPIGSPGATVPASAVDAARNLLCADSGDASLTGLATRLDQFDPATVDVAQFQVAAGTVATTLAQLNVTGEQVVLRDAAVTAVQSVQGADVDAETAAQAATAIRTLDTAIC